MDITLSLSLRTTMKKKKRKEKEIVKEEEEEEESCCLKPWSSRNTSRLEKPRKIQWHESFLCYQLLPSGYSSIPGFPIA